MRLAHKILNRLRRELRHAAAYARAQVFDTFPDDDDVLDAWQGKPPPASVAACVREWADGKPCVFADDLKTPADSAAVCAEADRILEGTAIIFRQPCALKLPELWFQDPLTLQPWPADVHFTRFDVFHPSRDGVTDIRRLWEIGRFGWALPLARAFSFTGDAKYARAWFDYVASFIEKNPPEFGPHWLNAMETAVRAVQWCRALALFFQKTEIPQSIPGAEGLRAAETVCGSQGQMAAVPWNGSIASLLPSSFALLHSLLAHGRYIRSHLEWTPYGRTNHYIANLAGLLTLAVFVPRFRESADWRRCALHGLADEIETQTDADGFHSEASTAYHHFALELHALVVALDRQHQLGFSGRFHERVCEMQRVDAAIRGPEDIDPRIGDDDSGALHTMGRALPGSFSSALDPAGSVALRKSGIYILRSTIISCHVACGPNGQQGVGGHAHNDKLSVVIRLKGRPIVVDAGTGCYSADVRLRDLYRSTQMHNTIVVDEAEQSPLKDWRKLHDHAHARCLEWRDSPDETFFRGEHQGYYSHGVIHRRAIRLDKRGHQLSILDELQSEGRHAFDFYIHFDASWVRADFRLENNRLILPGAEMIFQGTAPFELMETTISPIYGRQTPNWGLHLRGGTQGAWTMEWEFRSAAA